MTKVKDVRKTMPIKLDRFWRDLTVQTNQALNYMYIVHCSNAHRSNAHCSNAKSIQWVTCAENLRAENVGQDGVVMMKVNRERSSFPNWR